MILEQSSLNHYMNRRNLNHPTLQALFDYDHAIEVFIKERWTFLQSLPLQRLSKREEEKDSTTVRCVPIHPFLLLIWKLMCSLILVKSRSPASIVNTNAQQMVPSRHTCGHIQERSLSLACSVSSPAQQLVTSRFTWKSIVERNPSAAISATINALQLVN